MEKVPEYKQQNMMISKKNVFKVLAFAALGDLKELHIQPEISVSATFEEFQVAAAFQGLRSTESCYSQHLQACKTFRLKCNECIQML